MNINRRELIKNIIKASLAIPVLGFISACKKKPAPQSNINQDILKPCVHEVPLTHEQITTRSHLRYVEQSRIPTRTCDNCKIYINPQPGKDCGGCQVLTGPIHPKGWCMSWVARM